MKKLLSIAALSLLSLSGMIAVPAQAGTVGSSFNVKVNLTSACVIGTAATALDFGTYTAFGSATVSAPVTNVTFNCTNGLTPSAVALDTTGPTVVAGLAYTLSVDGGTKAAGSAGTASTAATADVMTYVVTGSMAAGQAGDVTAAVSATRTLTITY